MNIKLNGNNFEINAVTIEQLIKELGLIDKRIAVEVNKNVITKTEHSNYCLKNDDVVEIIRAVGGG